MITSAPRAKLRSMANSLEPIIYVGKEGITEGIISQVDDALEARELIKGSVQQNCDYTAREVVDALAEELGAEPVQAIGRKFVLYRRSEKKPKIEL